TPVSDPRTASGSLAESIPSAKHLSASQFAEESPLPRHSGRSACDAWHQYTSPNVARGWRVHGWAGLLPERHTGTWAPPACAPPLSARAPGSSASLTPVTARSADRRAEPVRPPERRGPARGAPGV